MRESVLLAGLLVLLGTMPLRAEPPPAEERARLVAEALKAYREFLALYQQGKMPEALGRAEKVLVLNRQLFPKKQFPNGHPNLAVSLTNVGIVLDSLGRLESALEHQQQALAMRRQLFPPDRFPDGHPDLVQSLNNVGVVLEALGRLESALEHQQQALAMRRKLYPPERFPDGHPDLAQSLNNVGNVLKTLGRLEPALEHQQQALAMDRKLYPPDRFSEGHRKLAISLNNMGVVLEALGRLEPALEHQQQALALRRQLFPPDRFPNGHPDLARSLNNVGVVLEALGRLESAQEHLQQALAMRRQLYPPDRFPDGHPDLAVCLNNLGNVLEAQGRLEPALEHQLQALATYRKLFPPDKFPDGHPDLARSLNNVGIALQTLGRLQPALEHQQQALAMRRQLFPLDRFSGGHTQLAQSLYSVGIALAALGRLESALEHQQQALALRRQLFPSDRFPEGHTDLANSLDNVGVMLEALGRRELALEHLHEALNMRRQLFPPDKFPNGHPHLANSLNNVGAVLGSLDRREPELEYQQQALVMRRKLFPSDRFPDGHTELADSLNNVGTALESLGRLEPALKHFQQALAMRRQLFPPARFPNGHAYLADSLNNVGILLASLGRLEAALEHQQQALAMRRQLFPPDRFPDGHTDLARSLNALGAVLLGSGKAAEAVDLWTEALRMQRGLIDQFALGASEAEALAFAHRTFSSLHNYLSATTGQPRADSATYAQVWTQRAALSRILQRRHLAALAAAANSEVRGLFDRLQQTRHELAALLLAPLPVSPEAQRSRDRRVNELTDVKQRLERDLVGLLPEADRQRRIDRLGPDDLTRALPHAAAFLDLLRYDRWEYDPNKPGRAGAGVRASYVAFVVVRGRPVRRVELGEARAIEEALADWRHLIEQRREQDSPETAAKLRRLVWEPLLEALPQPTRTVFLAPDAALTRLPWSALPGRQRGTILLEDHALAVVPHGPFLLEQLTSPGRFDRGRSAALALGGVGYSDAPVPLETPAPVRGPERDGAAVTWTDLPGSAREVRLLQKLYGAKVTHLEGSQADVARLLRALPQAPLAHLATHGFFNERVFRQEQLRAHLQVASLLRAQELVGEGTGRRVTQGALNPLSYTGLVLAGANKPKEAGVHGGILAGEALLTLDLRGLELTVLSACQTGLGDVANGECVHNLQQAFHSAGCPNVVASLWSVPDEATAALMGLFYHALLEEKLPPLQALQAAQLYLYRHPNEIPELAKRVERGAPLVAKGVKVAEPDPKPVAPAPSGRQRVAVKDWAGFVLSGVGK